MSETSLAETGGGTRSSPRFRGGLGPAVALLAFFAVWALILNALYSELFGSGKTLWTELYGIASSSLQLVVTVALLRYEGVRLRDVGLSRRLLVPALVAMAGLLVVLNAAAAGLIVAGGNELAVGLFADMRAPPYDHSLPTAVAASIHYYLFVGPAEELAFRGYLQNKLVAVLDYGSDRLRTALGIVGAATTFSLMHIPTIVILGDPTLGGVVGTLLLLTFSGIAFGTIYALTRNLFLVAFLHGIGDFSPLFVTGGAVAWPNWGLMLVCYGLLVVLYRRWATRTSRPTLGVAA